MEIGIIFVGMLIFVVWQMRKKFEQVVSHYEATQQGISVAERCILMSKTFAMDWGWWDETEWKPYLVGSSLSRSGFHKSLHGPMEMSVAGDLIRVFDCRFQPDRRSPVAMTYYQTVIAIKNLDCELPIFHIRPRFKLAHEGYVPNAHSFVTHTALDGKFLVEGILEDRIKLMLNTRIGFEHLIPFIMDRDWSIEWTGSQLLVYTVNQLIEPALIQQFALEVTELFDMLKGGADAMSDHYRQRVETALAEGWQPPTFAVR